MALLSIALGVLAVLALAAAATALFTPASLQRRLSQRLAPDWTRGSWLGAMLDVTDNIADRRIRALIWAVAALCLAAGSLLIGRLGWRL